MLVKFLLSVGLLVASFATACLPEDAADTSVDSAEIPVAAVESSAVKVAPLAETVESPKWSLQYKFTPDQKLRYKMIEDVTLDAMQGEDRKVDVTSFEQRRVFTVSSVDDSGAARLTMQYEFVKMQRKTNDLPEVRFDTSMEDKEVPPEFKNTARELKGSAPQFWISGLGAALQESDSEKGYAPAARSVAQAGNVIVGDKPAAFKEGDIKQAVAESATEPAEANANATPEAAKTSSANAVTFLLPLPENPVAINDTWREVIPVNVRVTQEISRKINILRTFRLESVDDGIATISFRSSVEAAVKSPTMRSQLIKATPKGTLTFDIERGIMVKRELRYDETVLNAIGQNSVVLCYGSSREVLMDSAD
ncbi:MAG: DUF6263 family protein [Planctomycetota bacterium]|nr:DUF6263 family protein [Planctomycetota bacterium]